MTLRFLALAGAGNRAWLAPWVGVTAGVLLACACAAQPPPSGTAEPPSAGAATAVPRILPPGERLQIHHAQRLRRSLVRGCAPSRSNGIRSTSRVARTTRLLITLMLDRDGNVAASELGELAVAFVARDADVEPERFTDRAYEFLASQGVPLEQAGASTSLFESRRQVEVQCIFDEHATGTDLHGLRPGAAHGFPPHDRRHHLEGRTSHRRETLSGALRGSGRRLHARLYLGVDGQPRRLADGRTRAAAPRRTIVRKCPAEHCRERAQILEARYPGIQISGPGKGEYIVDRKGKLLSAQAQLVLMVYWLDAESPLP